MIDNVCYFEHKLTTVCVTILKLDKLTNILSFFSNNNYHTNDLLYYFDEKNTF